MKFHSITTTGKWKKVGNTIKLKPFRDRLACFGRSKNRVALYFEDDKLILKSKVTYNERKIEKQISRNVGEEVDLTFRELITIVFRRMNN